MVIAKYIVMFLVGVGLFLYIFGQMAIKPVHDFFQRYKRFNEGIMLFLMGCMGYFALIMFVCFIISVCSMA